MLKLSKKKKKKKKKKKGSVDSPKGDISRVHPLKSAKGDEELRPVCGLQGLPANAGAGDP